MTAIAKFHVNELLQKYNIALLFIETTMRVNLTDIIVLLRERLSINSHCCCCYYCVYIKTIFAFLLSLNVAY